eukprot:TRINITY_DN3065_c0_g2_i1.p1 TRINITY_DN3065_c0_g2~~TRINITY_DN3065_c0_g2_i1.p1  ORF type:complete len:423 (-),score=114.94 TRINITY_DN3065_c0_g2_i1:149-1417(-)
MPALSTSVMEKGTEEEALRELRSASKCMQHCKLQLHELIERFFFFYTREFDWGKEVVSVRLGRRLDGHDGQFFQLQGRKKHQLHVEDPFEVTRNLNMAAMGNEEKKLQHAFNEAHSTIAKGGTPVGLRPLGPSGRAVSSSAAPKAAAAAASSPPVRENEPFLQDDSIWKAGAQPSTTSQRAAWAQPWLYNKGLTEAETGSSTASTSTGTRSGGPTSGSDCDELGSEPGPSPTLLVGPDRAAEALQGKWWLNMADNGVVQALKKAGHQCEESASMAPPSLPPVRRKEPAAPKAAAGNQASITVADAAAAWQGYQDQLHQQLSYWSEQQNLYWREDPRHQAAAWQWQQQQAAAINRSMLEWSMHSQAAMQSGSSEGYRSQPAKNAPKKAAPKADAVAATSGPGGSSRDPADTATRAAESVLSDA